MIKHSVKNSFTLVFDHHEFNLKKLLSLKQKKSTVINSVEIIYYDKDILSLSKIVTCIFNQLPFLIVNKFWPLAYQNELIKLLNSLDEKDIKDSFFMATSGSTGPPKLCCHHIISLVKSARRSLNHNSIKENQAIVLSLSPAHMGGLLTIVKALISGTTLLMSSSHWLIWLEKNTNLHFAIVPQQLLKLYAAIVKNPKYKSNILSILIGGDMTPLWLKDKCYKKSLPIIFSYGSTETCGQITGTLLGKKSSTSGKALHGVRFAIKQSKLTLFTPTLLKGIVTQQGLVKQKSNLGYLSNDIAKIRLDNSIVIIGRTDHQFKSGAELISPEFIEQKLLKSQYIKYIIIISRKDNELGNIPIAIVDSLKNINQLKAYSNEHLPLYMRPKEWKKCPPHIDFLNKSIRQTFKKKFEIKPSTKLKSL